EIRFHPLVVKDESYIFNQRDTSPWKLSLDIHNPLNRTVDISKMHFGVVLPAELGRCLVSGSITRLPGNKYMWNSQNFLDKILPMSYYHDDVNFKGRKSTAHNLSCLNLTCE